MWHRCWEKEWIRNLIYRVVSYRRDSEARAEGNIKTHPKISSEDRKDGKLGIATHKFKKSKE